MEQLIETHINRMIHGYKKRHEARGLADNTMTAVLRNFERINKYWGDKEISDITDDQFDLYQDWLDVKYPDQNRFNEIKFIKTLVNNLFYRGLIDRKPRLINRNAALEEVKRDKRNSRVYTDDELKILFYEKTIPQYKRDIFLLGYYEAMRFNECSKLTWDRVDMFGDEPQILFNADDHKTKKRQYIPIMPASLEMLKRRQGTNPKYVFTTPRANRVTHDAVSIRKILKMYEIEEGSDHNTRFHTFRRTRFTKLFSDPTIAHTVICKEFRITIETAMKYYIKSTRVGRDSLRAAA